MSGGLTLVGDTTHSGQTDVCRAVSQSNQGFTNWSAIKRPSAASPNRPFAATHAQPRIDCFPRLAGHPATPHRAGNNADETPRLLTPRVCISATMVCEPFYFANQSWPLFSSHRAPLFNGKK